MTRIDALNKILELQFNSNYSIEKKNLLENESKYRNEVVYVLYYDMGDNKLPMYKINVNYYYYCCGATNLGNLSALLNNSRNHIKPNLLLTFMLLIICDIAVERGRGLITLTLPGRKMPSAYKLAKQLLKIFNGQELKFLNSNTSNEVSHISLFTTIFDNFFIGILQRSYYLNSTIDELKIGAERSLAELKQFFDNLISKK